MPSRGPGQHQRQRRDTFRAILHFTDKWYPAAVRIANIDHRRVPNLMAFFSRKGENLSISTNNADYNPGDLVTWDLGGGIPHIGIVVDRQSALVAT